MLRGMDQISHSEPPVDDLDSSPPVALDEDNITVKDICDLLGRQEIALRVGVGITAVSNASAEGRFSPAWFLAIKGMCDGSGIPCPDRLFKFKLGRRDGAAAAQAGGR